MRRPLIDLSRRQLLRGGAALGAGLALPRSGRAATVSGADLKYLFVFAGGGWDPTRVFADGFDNPDVSMESGAERGTAGGISFVDAETRPSVRTFFEQHHASTVVMNGVLVRSIAHEICTMIALTGTTSGLVPDWPAALAKPWADRVTLPHLVMSGPSFPGDLGEDVVRSGLSGQLDALITGDIVGQSDVTLDALGQPSQGILDSYARRRAAARAAGSKSSVERALLDSYVSGLERATELKDLRYVMSFAASADLSSAGAVALEALSMGLARCVSLAYPTDFGGEWDTHAQNDALQDPLWEGLFQGLLSLMDTLRTLPGEVGATLADETVVVVLSEMGRTPALNPVSGKDHWPYTSMMLCGPGLQGDRVIGGWDASWYGQPVDPSSGEVDEGGQVLSAEAVGATLLQLGDVDPDEYVSGVEPIAGALG